MSYYSRVQRLITQQDAFSQKPILKELGAQIINATAALELNDTNWQFLGDLYLFPSGNARYMNTLPGPLKDAVNAAARISELPYTGYTIRTFRTTACKLYLQLYDIATEGTTARRRRPVLEALQGIKDSTIAVKRVKNLGYPTLQAVLDAYPVPPEPSIQKVNTLGNFPKKKRGRKADAS